MVSVVSVGDIASRIGHPIHRVSYIVRKRRIKPLLACGGRFFFSEGDVQRVKAELDAIDRRKAEIRAATSDAEGSKS